MHIIYILSIDIFLQIVRYSYEQKISSYNNRGLSALSMLLKIRGIKRNCFISGVQSREPEASSFDNKRYMVVSRSKQNGKIKCPQKLDSFLYIYMYDYKYKFNRSRRKFSYPLR